MGDLMHPLMPPTMPHAPSLFLAPVAASLLSVGLLAGCSDAGNTAPTGASAAPTAAASAPARRTAVGVLQVQPETVALSTELPGRTRAAVVAEIRPQVGGIVQARRFTEGAPVRAGQVLYQLDAATYRNAVASAEATLSKAEATVRTARQTAERQAELLKIDAVSRQAAQDAEATLQQAEAERNVARASLETARINLARTTVTSPISGRVDLSAVTPGALVTADQATALTTVRQTDPMLVDIPQSSSEWLRLQRALASGRLQGASASASVQLILEDGQPYAHRGQLSVAGVSVNSSTGAVTLRASFPNPQGLLLPGMAVRAVLPTAQAEGALLVPQQAVSRDASGQASVWVVGDDQKVARRSVQTERAVGNRWLVAQGLQAGERVVVEGQQKVKAGDLVQAQPMAGQGAQVAAVGGAAAAPGANTSAATPAALATTVR